MPEYMYWYNNMIKGQTTYLCSWRTNISAWDFDGESLIWIFFTLHGWVIMGLYSSHPINTGVSHWENQSVGMQQTINVNQSKATLETYNTVYKTLSNYHQIKEALFFTPWICLWIYILNILVTVRYLLPSNNESVKIQHWCDWAQSCIRIPYDSNLHFDDIIFLSNGFPERIS